MFCSVTGFGRRQSLRLGRGTLLLAVLAAVCTAAEGNMEFTVSMPRPANHFYHVMFRCDGLHGELQDFKLPQWSPGYYGIENYARNVSNFRPEDGSGRALGWEKVSRNTWRIVAAGSPVVVLNYDVFAAVSFPANSYLAESRGYISPAATFVYLSGQLQHPVTLHVQLPANWKQISTGLEPRQGRTVTFEAPDFNVLYDSPILMGNQEELRFDVKGVPHFVAIENVPADVDREKMLADLERIVTAATALMGDIPYRHYTFLMMGHGRGGIEHANSSANQFDGEALKTPSGYLQWLSFICHEYFHSFNVKRIRPLALGPFDYEQENLTNMLWVSEGLSVYYEDLLLVRAGLVSRDKYLAHMAETITAFENAPGRHYQAATEASQNAWISGSGVGGDRNTTISYYDNGAILGAMLDLKIRESSGNKHSLDDVMRTLYRTYYLEKRRGFTDAEFRAECESAAETSLAQIFEYASTTKEVEYAPYFSLAGLRLEVIAAQPGGGFIGLDTRTEEIPASESALTGSSSPRGSGGPAFRLEVTDVAVGSPAEKAAVHAGDRIISVDGIPASAAALNEEVNAKSLGEKIRLHLARAGVEFDILIEVAPNVKKTYRLWPASGATAAEKRLLNDWLRKTL